MPQSVVTQKSMIVMDQTACSIKGVLDDLRVKLSILDAEIKADAASKKDFERLLNILQKRKDELVARIDDNEAWVTSMDNSGFADKYTQMTAEIGLIYEKAKVGHSKCIGMLKSEFGYHPEFKRPSDTFFGIPFKPL